MRHKIYGASDDLHEVDGPRGDEFYGDYIEFSTGDVFRLHYGDNGVWRIEQLASSGKLAINVSVCLSDGDGDDYSDIATVDGDVDWIVAWDNYPPKKTELINAVEKLVIEASCDQLRELFYKLKNTKRG